MNSVVNAPIETVPSRVRDFIASPVRQSAIADSQMNSGLDIERSDLGYLDRRWIGGKEGFL